MDTLRNLIEDCYFHYKKNIPYVLGRDGKTTFEKSENHDMITWQKNTKNGKKMHLTTKE